VLKPPGFIVDDDLAGPNFPFLEVKALVQHLQKAKLSFELPPLIKKLDRDVLLVLDGVSYVRLSKQQSAILYDLNSNR